MEQFRGVNGFVCVSVHMCMLPPSCTGHMQSNATAKELTYLLSNAAPQYEVYNRGRHHMRSGKMCCNEVCNRSGLQQKWVTTEVGYNRSG